MSQSQMLAMPSVLNGSAQPDDLSLALQDRPGTTDQLTDTLRHLVLENTELKRTVQTNNKTMKAAHDLLADFEQRASRERAEQIGNYEQVKNTVTSLRRKITEQEQVINMMKQQAAAQPVEPGQDVSALHAQISSMTTDVYLKSTQIAQMTQERDELLRSLDAARSDINALTASLKKSRTEVEQTAVDYHEQLLANDDLKKKELEVKETLQRMLSQKKENDERIDNLTAQLYSAEDTLAMKDETIRDKTRQIEDLTVLAAQAEIYKGDFSDERKAREELNDKKIVLEERVKALEEEGNRRGSPGQRSEPPSSRDATPPGNNPFPANNHGQTGADAFPQHQPNRNGADHPASAYEETHHPHDMDRPGGAVYAGQKINDRWEQQQPAAGLYPNLPNPALINLNLREDNSSGSLQSNTATLSEAAQVDERRLRTVVQLLSSSPQEPAAYQTTVISDFVCPFCFLEAPDFDSLQLHINDTHPDQP